MLAKKFLFCSSSWCLCSITLPSEEDPLRSCSGRNNYKCELLKTEGSCLLRHHVYANNQERWNRNKLRAPTRKMFYDRALDTNKQDHVLGHSHSARLHSRKDRCVIKRFHSGTRYETFAGPGAPARCCHVHKRLNCSKSVVFDTQRHVM